jgi:hypothetical protein
MLSPISIVNILVTGNATLEVGKNVPSKILGIEYATKPNTKVTIPAARGEMRRIFIFLLVEAEN